MEKPLWAPWRIEYILGEKSDECFICKALREDRDRDNLILKRGTHCLVIMNRYPYNNGHLMIAANRHIDTIELMTGDEQLEWMSLTAEIVAILKKEMQPQGLNIGVNLGQVAGAGLKDHIHQHVVPRWSGDTNFMPVISDTRVVAQSLTELYDQLLPAFISRDQG